MNIENELKLIPAKNITKEQIIIYLQKIGIIPSEKSKVIHQEDTYFDDKDGSLENVGGSFRIRRKGDKIQVTYKIPIESNTQYKQRKEYEIVVPKEYEKTIDMNLAIKLLKEQYPELTFPENMGETLTVINDRDKVNLVCPDGTVLEMAFDSLMGRDEKENLYYIHPEIEFETVSGNSENLTKVYENILENFPGQTRQNFLSKYARTKKEIQDKQLTAEEIATCVMFSEILNSEEFNKLQYKGQILHRYDKPTLTNLDNFKDFNYLIETLRKIKSGQYKIAIPKSIAENPENAKLLEGENYEVKEKITLEDMMCLLLTDTKYIVADNVLADFLNQNYYGPEHAMTNRLSHSQQVMLGTGLACKSSQIKSDLEEKLTSMISAISHDIGHVPLSHTLESLLKQIDGIFTHDANGQRVIDNIYEEKESEMFNKIKPFFPEIDDEQIKEILERKKDEIALAVASHSRKNSDERGRGINVQGPRVSDKVLYVASDACDLIRYADTIQGTQINIFDDAWIESAIRQFCEKEDCPYDYEAMKEMLDKQYIPFLKNGNYGRAVVNAMNSIRKNAFGGTVYYEVDPQIWGFIELLISRIKDVREDLGIERTKSKMTIAASTVLMEEFYKAYTENNGNIDLAWEEVVDKLTKMGELDLVDYLKQTHNLGEFGPLLNRQETITTERTNQITQKMQQRVYTVSKIKGMTDKQAQEEAKKIGEMLEKLPPEQVLAYFEKYRFAKTIPIEEILEQLHNRADVQLKIQPERNVSVNKILRDLKLQQTESLNKPIDQFQEIVDLYYRVKPDEEGKKKVSAKIRHVSGENFKTLIVKVEVKKNVAERIARKYEVQCPLDSSIEEMMQKLKAENVGLDVELLGSNPYEEITTERTNFIREYGADQIVFSVDYFSGKNGPEMQEIEIKCKDNPRAVSKIKNKLRKLYGKGVFVKGGKIDRVEDAKEQEIR